MTEAGFEPKFSWWPWRLEELDMTEWLHFHFRFSWWHTQDSLHYPTLPLYKRQHRINYCLWYKYYFHHGFSIMIWFLNPLSCHSCKSHTPIRVCLIWGREDAIVLFIETTRTLGEIMALVAGAVGKFSRTCSHRQEKESWRSRNSLNSNPESRMCSVCLCV